MVTLRRAPDDPKSLTTAWNVYVPIGRAPTNVIGAAGVIGSNGDHRLAAEIDDARGTGIGPFGAYMGIADVPMAIGRVCIDAGPGSPEAMKSM